MEEVLVEDAQGKPVAGISVTCSFCDHVVELPGHDCHDLRVEALNLLHRGCPERFAGHCHYIPAETDD